MTNCPDVLVLQSYIDGELAADEAQAVARHLEGCPECRRIVMSMQAAHSALGATPPASPPSRLFADIQAAVAAHGHGLACDQAHEMISALLDDELSAEQAATLDLHLQECADCRYYAERMGAVTKLLRGMEAVAAEPGLRARIEAAVDKAARYAGISRIYSAGFRRKLGAAAGLAAAAAIMLVVAFNFAHITGPPQPSPTSPPEIIASTPAPAPQPEPISARATEPEAAATRPPAPPTAADTPPQPATRTHRPPRVTSAPTPRVEPARSPAPVAPAPAISKPQPAKAVTVMPLVGSKPVAIAHRTETPPAATAPSTAEATAGEALIRTPIKMVVISEPEATPPPAPAEATLAKARPSTPTTLKSTERAPSSGAMRLASAGTSWLPVSKAPRTVYKSAATSPARLASVTERISKEIDDIRHSGLASPGIVVMK